MNTFNSPQQAGNALLRISLGIMFIAHGLILTERAVFLQRGSRERSELARDTAELPNLARMSSRAASRC